VGSPQTPHWWRRRPRCPARPGPAQPGLSFPFPGFPRPSSPREGKKDAAPGEENVKLARTNIDPGKNGRRRRTVPSVLPRGGTRKEERWRLRREGDGAETRGRRWRWPHTTFLAFPKKALRFARRDSTRHSASPARTPHTIFAHAKWALSLSFSTRMLQSRPSTRVCILFLYMQTVYPPLFSEKDLCLKQHDFVYPCSSSFNLIQNSEKTSFDPNEVFYSILSGTQQFSGKT